MSNDEIALAGGRLTPGVVRVGDTVRRPESPSSAFMARVLLHLEERGFHGAPRFLGKDSARRDVLSFLPGQVTVPWQRYADAQVRAAGALLRDFHAATRGSALAGTAEAVCHNDPGPNNVVFRAGTPVAFIDFDLAAPGETILDLGYMAWSWCVASKPARQPVAAQAAQVRLLADAYGLDAPARRDLTGAILERQGRNIAFWEVRRDDPRAGEGVLSRTRIAEVIAWSHQEMLFTIENRAIFERALR